MAMSLSLSRLLFAAAMAVSAVLPAHADAPGRVAIAGGTATEIAWRLGAADRIVAVDQTSSFPAEAAAKPQLGYFRRLSAEGIIAVAPDLLLASAHAGPPAVLDQVRAAGIEVAVMPELTRLADIPGAARFVGDALGLPGPGAALADDLEAEIEALGETPAGPDAPRLLFVLTLSNGAPLVAGQGTAPDEVIRTAGAQNVATFDGFKPMSREAVIAAAPDLILLTAEHVETLGGAEALLTRPDFAETPAGRAGRSLALPALAVLGLGPRTPAAIRTLRDALAE